MKYFRSAIEYYRNLDVLVEEKTRTDCGTLNTIKAKNPDY
jgi:hypothetical protein